ncbi:MAG TPA: hypothetical protein VN063_04025 [Methylophilaceae bacterium]|nr:hypothetical protein [Methylophilaceae bacterium]
MMRSKRLPSYEWDAIAGILAAVVAIVLHLLHVVDETIVLPILLALLGLLFLNFMRHTHSNERTAEQVDMIANGLVQMQQRLKAPEVLLIGPRQLRSVNELFVRQMRGDTLWYNLCLSMYTPPPLFDALLRPALESPMVTSVQFVLDTSQQALWQSAIKPRLASCTGSEKVREPRWCKLDKTLSFIMADSQVSGGTEALLSFWGEPFMAQSNARDIPRFIFHVQKDSTLLPHLVEVQRNATPA